MQHSFICQSISPLSLLQIFCQVDYVQSYDPFSSIIVCQDNGRVIMKDCNGKDFSLQLELKPGPGCSKLTTSLVNETLKFQTLISQICQ